MSKYFNILYNRDESGLVGFAEMVFFPKNTEEVKEIIKNFTDIVPRGGGNNIVGGCVPNNSTVVDMKNMNNVIFKDNNIFVEAGITIKELNEKLKAIKREFPIILEDSRTIGGVIAMNDSGYFGAYGNIKDWLDEVEFVNGNGDLINVKKTDFSDLCGLEGITGIIVKAKIKTIPIIEKSFSIFQTDKHQEALAIAKKLKTESIMLRLYSPYISSILGLPEKYHVIAGFNSNRGKIKNEENIKIFNIIKKEIYCLRADGYYNSEEAMFLFERLEEYISFLDSLSVPYFGDLHLGIIQTFFKDESVKKNIIKTIQIMNGRPAKYGIGIKRKDLLDNLQKRILRRIKSRHDPLNKMNRGKVIDFDPIKDIHIEKTGTEEALIVKKIKKLDKTKKAVSDSKNIHESEIYNEKREEIEEFAKNIPNEILKKHKEENEKEEKNNKTFSENIGKVILSDNLERKSISSEEMEIINKIMFNKTDKVKKKDNEKN